MEIWESNNAEAQMNLRGSERARKSKMVLRKSSWVRESKNVIISTLIKIPAI